ncbi:acyl-CoA dehydrogenase family protein [Gordonia polyisoprenivorans]|uniref:acyl-CoA dehydrogenase family protein n=1 Tax=Gordonia polyisoprenivorans TaxID=84595 RepID=UPI0030CC3F5E
MVDAAEARLLAELGEFIAEVLGPRLLIETGNPFRDNLLPLVAATAELTADADRAIELLAVDIAGHVIERNEDLTTVVTEDQWGSLAFDGAVGAAKVAYSAGFGLSDTEYFAAAGLGAQALRTAASPTDTSVDLRHSTLAAAEKSGSWDPALVRTRAHPSGDRWSITGEKWYVPGTESADTLLVVARTAGGPSLYHVARSAPGVDVEVLPSLDPARPLGHITFTDAPATLIGREGAGGRIMNRTVDKATTVLAGEQTGMVDRALKTLCELLPPCNDSAAWNHFTRKVAELEVVRQTATALWYRAVKYDTNDNLDSAAVAAAMAHIGCSSAVRAAALEITTVADDVDSRFVETFRIRARATDLLLGGPALSHERLLERLGI